MKWIPLLVSLVATVVNYFRDQGTEKQVKNEIENQARKESRDTRNEILDDLDKPVDIDGLPDEFFEPESDTSDTK